PGTSRVRVVGSVMMSSFTWRPGSQGPTITSNDGRRNRHGTAGAPRGSSPADGGPSRPGARCSPRLGRRVLEGTDLGFAFEPGPVNPVKLHDLRGEGHRFVVYLGFAQCVAAHDLFGLAERAVGDVDLPRGEPDPPGFCQR